MENLRVIELFAGVGSQTQALKNIGLEHEVVGIAEIERYAIESYKQLHGEVNNFGDISKIEKLPIADLWTYSFPCQDISVAGKGEGIKEGTRSGLLYEVERLLEVSEKPKYLLMENVKNLIGKKHIGDFNVWCKKLEELGYKNYYEVLNAKDYGVPQNRERVFMISIFGEHEEYIFPKKKELKLRLKDVLESEVDEKYYLSQEVVERFIFNKIEKDFTKTNETICLNSKGGRGGIEGKQPSLQDRVYSSNGISTAITTGFLPNIALVEKTDKIIQLGNVAAEKNFKNPQVGRIYSVDGVSPTLNTMGGGQREPKVLQIREATKKAYKEGYVGDSINLEQPNSKTRRGRVGSGISNTLLTACNQGVIEQDLRIRKLTPRECWRLMGWKDEQFDKIKGISNSQLYRQAGNGIVVNVLEEIFRELFKK